MGRDRVVLVLTLGKTFGGEFGQKEREKVLLVGCPALVKDWQRDCAGGRTASTFWRPLSRSWCCPAWQSFRHYCGDPGRQTAPWKQC